MDDNSSLYPHSDKIKKALVWICETLEDKPQLSRKEAIQQAVIRFDLSPADSTFLEKNFSTDPERPDNFCGGS
ncbi:hypothetical protein [Desulfogranum mediterraneum]|uniref:hypothetical protein n=1 Tax=Desulfogranum mediterraneum TaxID=160661 RepID=UPI0004198BBB|nr:hypothetical protein [Desulfogranum mediterraneum]